jgi:drug/metabolite transporter (DMT)-like permease
MNNLSCFYNIDSSSHVDISGFQEMVISDKKLHVRSVMLLFPTAVLWSFGGLLIKSINWNPLAIAGTRSAIAIPVLMMIVRKSDFTYSWAKIFGAFFYAATVILYVCANKLTTAANVIILQYTASFYVAILSFWLLKEKVNKYDWIVIFIALFGVFLFFVGELSLGHIVGNILALICGIAFALMIIFLRMQKDSSPLGSVFLGNMITVLCMLPFMFHAIPEDPASWTALSLLGIFQVGLSYILYTIAIKYVTALEAVLITLIEPIINPLWVFLFLGEKPTPWALLGGAIVVVSLIVHLKIKAKQESIMQ